VIVDCSSPISGAAAAAAGVTGVIGYLSGIPGPKIWTAERLADCTTHKIAVGFVFENTTADMAGGAPAGMRNASIALWELANLFSRAFGEDVTGSEVGVYLADDHNTPTAGAGAYMKTAQAVLESHGVRTGYYGNQTAAVFLLDVGVTHLAWGVSSWGADVLRRCQLRQEANTAQMKIGATLCDVNTALASDWGQWPRP